MDGFLGRVKEEGGKMIKHLWDATARSSDEMEIDDPSSEDDDASSLVSMESFQAENINQDGGELASPTEQLHREFLHAGRHEELQDEHVCQLETSKPELVWDPQDFQQSGIIVTQAGPQERFPLTSVYSEVFKFQGQYGYEETALSVTPTMIMQLNSIFQSQEKLSRYNCELEELSTQRETMQGNAQWLAEHLESCETDEERESDLADLQEANDRLAKLDAKTAEVTEKVRVVSEEMEQAKASLFGDFREVLGRYDLLEPCAPESEAGSPAPQEAYGDDGWGVPRPGQDEDGWGVPQTSPGPEQQEYIPTEEELARFHVDIAKDSAREEALVDAQRKEIRFQGLEHRLENWREYYDERYAEFYREVEAGRASPARTLFDNRMLLEQRETNTALIEAEAELEAAEARLLTLGDSGSEEGLYYRDHAEPEGKFRDYHYRESFEASMEANVDRHRIENWQSMVEGGHEDVPEEREGDEWEAKEVGPSDSVSVNWVAVGRERRDIDRWRETWKQMCELRKYDALSGFSDDSSEDEDSVGAVHGG